jgi:hypothetical protein
MPLLHGNLGLFKKEMAFGQWPQILGVYTVGMLEMCERCRDTQKLDNGTCPVCRQQAVHQGYPLAILREGHF